MRTTIFCLGPPGVLLFALATGAFAQAKPADNSAAQIDSVKELLDLVPKKTMQELKQRLKLEDARKSANVIFAREAKSKVGSFKIKATGWDPFPGGGDNTTDRFRMILSQPSNAGGLNMQVNFWIYFPPEQEPVLAKTAKGKEVTVIGELAEVQITNDATFGLALVITLFHAKIE